MKFLLLALMSCTAWAAERPNIIFILADDLGWGDVGVFHQNARRAAGLPAEFTPHLDAMAAEGARFTNHYTAAPVCAPSRASLLLGVTQGHANVRNNQFDKALEENHTLATVLRRAGYSTAVIGKWGLHGQPEQVATVARPDAPAHPLNRGFDYFYGILRHVDGHEHYPKEALYFGEKAKTRGPLSVWDNRTNVTADLDKCYSADLFTARAKRWITEQKRAAPDRPFFLYLAFDTPHAVLELPTQAYPAGGGLKGGMQWLGEPGHMINTASGKIDSWVPPEIAAATYDDDHDAATPAKPWPDVYQRQATSVHRLDACVGDLLQLLKDLKIDDDTLVVFSSDNGPEKVSFLPNEEYSPEFFTGYGPFDGIKRDCWEGGMREPTIVRWPHRIAGGRVIDVPSGLWDWLPTFAEVAGLPPPARADGVSLLPWLKGRDPTSADPARILYFEYNVTGRTPNYRDFERERRNRARNQMQSLRLGDLVAIRYDVKGPQDDFEIYDVVQDPKEAKNLAAEPRYADLQKKFKELATQSRRPDAEAPRPYDDEPMAAVAKAETARGVRWSYYEGRFPWVPDFRALAATATGILARPDLSPRRRDTDIGFRFDGYINAPADGEYTFYLTADTGAFLRVHDASVIDADFGYAAGTERRGSVRLKQGLHPFRLSYVRAGLGSPGLSLSWSSPVFPREPIPAEAFRRDP